MTMFKTIAALMLAACGTPVEPYSIPIERPDTAVAHDMATAHDAAPINGCPIIDGRRVCADLAECGGATANPCDTDANCDCGRICLHDSCTAPGRCVDPRSSDGGACGHQFEPCCDYPTDTRAPTCRDGLRCISGACISC